MHNLSGSTQNGTTLLGLYNAAADIGFTAQGVQISCEYLIENNNFPVVLHVNQNHFVVCYGYVSKPENSKKEDTFNYSFIIGDPANGFRVVEKKELINIWETQKCLLLEPNENFEIKAKTKLRQRRWLYELVRPDLSKLTITIILGLFISVLSLTTAVFLQKLVDMILPEKDYDKLFAGIFFVLLLLTAKDFLNYFRQKLLFGQAQEFNIRINDLFYSHLLFMPQAFFDSRKIGELTARLNDTSKIQRFISQVAGNAAVDFLGIIISVIFIFSYVPPVGLLCISIIPLYYLLIYYFAKRIADEQRGLMKAYAITESNYINSLQGIDVIKSFDLEIFFLTSGTNVYSKYQKRVFETGVVQSRLICIVNFFATVILCIILLKGSLIVLNKEMTAGKLIAVAGICVTLLSAIANLAILSTSFCEAKIAFDRMLEFTNSKIKFLEAKEISKEQFHRVTLKNIAFRFRGQAKLLHNISFDIAKGEFVALMGENGSGKSTISKILQKEYDCESGQILVNENISLAAITLTDWRKIYAVAPQKIHIFNGTVLENIGFGDATECPEKVIEFLKQYGFTQFIDKLPHSVFTLVGEEGINLSGGQMQMIALARALYKKPQLLILDEATAAMDRESEKFVLRLLAKLKKEMAVIFITHRLHVLKSFCDRIYILENGVITAMGNHDKLLQTENLYSKYWADITGKHL